MHRTVIIYLGLVLLVAGCDTNPDVQPDLSEVAGTWVPTTHGTRPPTQFLWLGTNHTFVASNFPVSPSFGETATVSASGSWELSPSYAAFVVKFVAGDMGYELRLVGRHSPFVLTESIYDDDETLRSRRLEDTR
jgi:hypothetical protein